MKNAKRNITLNEKDSIEDMAQTERALFFAYARALFGARRKETREMLWKGMERAAKNAFFLAEIAKNTSKKNREIVPKKANNARLKRRKSQFSAPVFFQTAERAFKRLENVVVSDFSFFCFPRHRVGEQRKAPERIS